MPCQWVNFISDMLPIMRQTATTLFDMCPSLSKATRVDLVQYPGEMTVTLWKRNTVIDTWSIFSPLPHSSVPPFLYSLCYCIFSISSKTNTLPAHRKEPYVPFHLKASPHLRPNIATNGWQRWHIASNTDITSSSTTTNSKCGGRQSARTTPRTIRQVSNNSSTRSRRSWRGRRREVRGDKSVGLRWQTRETTTRAIAETSIDPAAPLLLMLAFLAIPAVLL